MRILKILYSSYAYLLALVLLPVLGFFALIFSFFGNLQGGNLIYKACNIYARIWFLLVGISYQEIGRPAKMELQQYIFIANHTSYLDVFCMLRAMRQPVRALGKAEMSKYPLFGYFYKKVVVMVDRASISMRAQSFAVLKTYLKQNISIFIFPEGTFNETGEPLKDFYDGAFKIAIDTETPIQPLLFLDNLKRMHHKGSFNLTPGKCRVVFLDEIAVEKNKPQTVSQLKEVAKADMIKGLLKSEFL